MSLLLALTAGGAPGAITGTAAWTSDDDTIAAAASFTPLPVTGTAAWTEGNDTLVATGAVQVTAVVAVTEGDDTIVATGTGGVAVDDGGGSHGGGFRKPQYFPPPKRRPVIQLIEPMLPVTPVAITASTKWAETDDHAVIAASFVSFDFTNQDFELLLLLAVV